MEPAYLFCSNTTAKLFAGLWEFGEPPLDKFDLQKHPAGVLSYHDIESLIANLNSRTDKQFQARSTDGRHWETFAKELDVKLRQFRMDAKKTGNPKRLFSNLKVVKTSPQKQYPSAGHWSGELQTNGYMVDGCTIVQFSPNTGGNGHAIAVYQSAPDKFIFFDPNLGALSFSREKLKGCLQHLFWAPAVRAEEDVLDGDKAVYLRRKTASSKAQDHWNKMGYTIFQRK
jgi:hypothetical protein